MPRAAVASIALSRAFAEGLELGAVSGAEGESEVVLLEQPTTVRLATRAKAMIRIYPNLPESSRITRIRPDYPNRPEM